MNLVFHKKNLGFRENHLVYNFQTAKFETTNIIKDTDFIWGSETFETFMKLNGFDIPPFPSKKHLNTFKEVDGTILHSNIPWAFTMPPSSFKSHLKELVGSISTSFQSFKEMEEYYRKYFLPLEEAFTWLEPVKIHNLAYKYWNSMATAGNHLDNVDNKKILNSFSPNSSGFSEIPKYSRVDTKTGRMKVVSGPNILNLSAEKRNILTSRYGFDGRILSIDFSALEPRVALALTGKSFKEDVYLLFLKNTFKNIQEEKIQEARNKMKHIITSRIYGASLETLEEEIKYFTVDLEGFIEELDSFFYLKDLKIQLLSEWEANNRKYIKNHFGRKIDCSEAKPYILPNYKFQSSAVDIALFGFKELISQFKDLKLSVNPIFFIHDELLIDCHRDSLKSVKSIVSQGITNIPTLSNICFPLKLTKFF